MDDSNTIEYLAEYCNQEEEQKKIKSKIIAGILLIPVTVAIFFYLPMKIADSISYYQSKKFGEK